jgi:hypothetical protein
VATDVASRAAHADTVPTPRAVHRRRAWLLLASAAFNLWLWATRIRNLVGDADENTAAFLAVHGVLYASAIAVAVVVGAIGWRQLRESRSPTEPTA